MGGFSEEMVVSFILFSRPDLWQWLSAAFPRAKYCLASATLTDASVEDMQGFPFDMTYIPSRRFSIQPPSTSSVKT